MGEVIREATDFLLSKELHALLQDRKEYYRPRGTHPIKNFKVNLWYAYFKQSDHNA